jgi:hypothetical protein
MLEADLARRALELHVYLAVGIGARGLGQFRGWRRGGTGGLLRAGGGEEGESDKRGDD